MSAAHAFASGLWKVVRAPFIVAAVVLVTAATAVPFALVVGSHLQTALDAQPPISRDAGDIDPEWWLEFREHAQGLDATFTPTIIGFAAPLDNLSSVLDGTIRPLSIAGPIALSLLVWAALWGVLIRRFGGSRVSIGEVMSAALRYAPRLALISVLAAIGYLSLYLTVHALLFGPVFEWLATHAASERNTFAWRVALYAIFAGIVAPVALVVDYARIHVVAGASASARTALVDSGRFVRANLGSAVLLYVLIGMLFAALLSAYGVMEFYRGARLIGWNGIVLGQAYIVARLGLRLVLVASEVTLFETVRRGISGH